MRKARWHKGIVEWEEGQTTYLSVVFTWDLRAAWGRAAFHHGRGREVHVGGPALHVSTAIREDLKGFARVGGFFLDAVARHNPMATFASRGCPVGCWFCIVPSMEGRDFTLLPDFPVRPILCDNNLSALPSDYQDYIVERYRATGVPLLDANSGFEPRTFDEEVYTRWKTVNRGPWRFALDDMGDLPHVLPVLEMLKDVPAARKRVYVLIGNEPYDVCMERIQLVIDRGAEPHVQPLMKLNALAKTPWVQHKLGWCHLCNEKRPHRLHSDQLLRDVARWANAFVWRKATFGEYRRNLSNRRTEQSAATPALL